MAKTPKKEKAADKPGLEIFDMPQGSEEWFAARCGIPTASRFHHIMADSEDRKMRTRYLYDLAGEQITGEPAKAHVTEAMERGKEMEPEALAYYTRTTFAEMTPVGFGKNSGLSEYAVVGASPDQLIDKDGGLEIKTKEPALLIEQIKRGATISLQFKTQCQGNIWVFEREWWDLMFFYRKMPPFQVRLYRDDKFIEKMKDEIERFDYELKKLVEDLRKMPR